MDSSSIYGVDDFKQKIHGLLAERDTKSLLKARLRGKWSFFPFFDFWENFLFFSKMVIESSDLIFEYDLMGRFCTLEFLNFGRKYSQLSLLDSAKVTIMTVFSRNMASLKKF